MSSPVRMRLIGWQVQPVLMADDGDQLTPISIDPQMIPAARWQEFKDVGDVAALEHIRREIEGASPAAQALAIAERAVQAAQASADERDEALELADDIGRTAMKAARLP